MKKSGWEICMYTLSCTFLRENAERQIFATSMIDNKSGTAGVEAL